MWKAMSVVVMLALAAPAEEPAGTNSISVNAAWLGGVFTNSTVPYSMAVAVRVVCPEVEESEWLTLEEKDRFAEQLTLAYEIRSPWLPDREGIIIAQARLLIAERMLDDIKARLARLREGVAITNDVTWEGHPSGIEMGLASNGVVVWRELTNAASAARR